MKESFQKKDRSEESDGLLTKEEYVEILSKNRELRKKRQDNRKQRKSTPLDNIYPRLVLSTFADSEGIRMPGDNLSLASDISIQDQKINILVYNNGSLPSFGTLVEFRSNPRTEPIEVNTL